MRLVSPFFAVLALLLAALPTSAEAEELRRIRTIVLDPGHGGENHGAVGVAGIYERFLTLATANALRRALIDEFEGVTVLLTREADVDLGLSERTHFANLHEADLFLSIHYNAAVSDGANGIEVYYLSAEEPVAPEALDEPMLEAGGATVASILGDLERTRLHGESATLAETLHGALIEATGATDRGVRQGQFRVLRGAGMPAVVIELGFLTNPEEGAHVLDAEYQHVLVDALVAGVAAYDAMLAGPPEAGDRR